MKEKGSQLYQFTLVILSFYVLTVLVLEAFVVKDSEIRQVLQFIDFFVCLIFLADFFYNLYSASSKLDYLKWGWIDFISSIPVIDPLRWGRLARVVRVFRFLRGVRSMRILYNSIMASRFESLTLVVFLITFVTFTISVCLILEFERPFDSAIKTSESALWWGVLNILNAKVALDQVKSTEGIIATMVLNKLGLLIFAYINASIFAWLIQGRNTPSAPQSAKIPNSKV